MPRGDRTGPAGMGPMTGRGVGYCAGYDTPGYLNPVGGRMGGGFGRGRANRPAPGMGGRGRGRMNMYYATGHPGWARYGYPNPLTYYPNTPYQPTKEEEMEYLKSAYDDLKKQLELIDERLETLKAEENEG